VTLSHLLHLWEPQFSHGAEDVFPPYLGAVVKTTSMNGVRIVSNRKVLSGAMDWVVTGGLALFSAAVQWAWPHSGVPVWSG
jgi:hypothetical protein